MRREGAVGAAEGRVAEVWRETAGCTYGPGEFDGEGEAENDSGVRCGRDMSMKDRCRCKGMVNIDNGRLVEGVNKYLVVSRGAPSPTVAGTTHDIGAPGKYCHFGFLRVGRDWAGSRLVVVVVVRRVVEAMGPCLDSQPRD